MKQQPMRLKKKALPQEWEKRLNNHELVFMNEMDKEFKSFAYSCLSSVGDNDQRVRFNLATDVQGIRDFIHKTINQAVTEVLERVEKEVVGADKPRNPDYSLLNAFRRMEEDVREHINNEKRKQRAALAKMKEEV